MQILSRSGKQSYAKVTHFDEIVMFFLDFSLQFAQEDSQGRYKKHH